VYAFIAKLSEPF